MNSVEKLIAFIEDKTDYRPDGEEACDWYDLKEDALEEFESLLAFQKEAEQKYLDLYQKF
jgi:hypothetical protein